MKLRRPWQKAIKVELSCDKSTRSRRRERSGPGHDKQIGPIDESHREQHSVCTADVKMSVYGSNAWRKGKTKLE